MKDVRFYPFPTQKKAPALRKRWLDLLRRENYEPKRNHRVCSLHFKEGRPTENHPYPELFAYNNFKESLKMRSTTSISKREQCMVKDTQFDISVPPRVDSPAASESVLQTQINNDNSLFVAGVSGELNGSWPVNQEIEVTDHECPTVGSLSVTGTHVEMDHCYISGSFCSNDMSTRDIGIQTTLTTADIKVLEEKSTKLEDPEKLMRELFVNKVVKDDKNVQMYTGLPSKTILNGVYDILEKASPTLKYWSGQGSAAKKKYQKDSLNAKSGPKRKLSRFQEFVLTLVRLRLALTTFVMADLFGVSTSRVSQVFTTWINFMFTIFKPLLKWPSRNVLKKFMPSSFRAKFPNVNCIIDCTEFFIKKPRNPTAQSQTFSSYKHHNTYKALVGVSPSGAFSFISNLWGGNVSDRYITKESGFLDNIQPGDEIMADRGFLIRDLLLHRRAKLIIPPFTRKCSWGKGKYLSASEILRTRNIAKFRIHVERAIGRLKTFHMLSNTMPTNLKPLADQMLVICAFLCNLQKPLVKK